MLTGISVHHKNSDSSNSKNKFFGVHDFVVVLVKTFCVLICLVQSRFLTALFSSQKLGLF